MTFQKGQSPWNKGKKGSIPWNKGKKYTIDDKESKYATRRGRISWNKGKSPSAETRKKISESLKGNKLSNETKKKISKANKGNRASNETKLKLRKSKLGKKNPMYGKPAHNKGKSPSAETGRKLSESLKKIVKYYSKQERLEQSKRAKDWIAIHGHNRTGTTASLETKKKMSIARKGKKHSVEWSKRISESNLGKIISKETRKKISTARAKQKFPYKDTKIEVLTQSILEENDISFVKHKNFKLSDSNHQADIVIEPDKVIEVNGDYWHFNPKKYDGESNQKKRGKDIKAKDVWKYDKYVIDGMKEQGYKVFVVWESELKDELEKTTKKILKFVKAKFKLS